MKSQARSFDKILKIRLSELSTASSSYMAALIKEFRLQIKSDIAEASTTMQDIEKVIATVQKNLQSQQHEPELLSVYILYILIFLLLTGIYITLKATRDSIINF